MRLIGNILLIAIIFQTTLFSQTKEVSPDDRGYIVSVGDKVDNFQVELIDGTKKFISEFDNDVVVLNFFASWCTVCRKEIPHIEKEVWQAMKSKGVLVLGMNYKEDQKTAQAYINEMKITYPVALDEDGTVFEKFARGGVTRNIVLNRQREIIYLTRLFNEKEFEGMIHFIRNEIHMEHKKNVMENDTFATKLLTDLCDCGLQIVLKYHGKYKTWFEGKIFSRNKNKLKIGISIFDEDIVSSKYNKKNKSLDIIYRYYPGIRIAILSMKKFDVPADIKVVNIYDFEE
ncbi:TlpA family protein disulfide reductase [candidate division KSB1 bacterium]|nr:TlpA family protein disulfide reductase [candidate division KSB1 bacterium]